MGDKVRANMGLIKSSLDKVFGEIDRVGEYGCSYHCYDKEPSEAIFEMRLLNQLENELRRVKYKLDYWMMPVQFEGTLYKNSAGRYQVEGSETYYTSGELIEFFTLCCDTYEEKEVGAWVVSSVENTNGEYYIVGYPEIKLDGLRVRVK